MSHIPQHVPLGQKPRSSDPAPSRMAYRFQRLWLTPVFRLAVRAGLPLVVMFGATSLYFSDETRRENAMSYVAELRRQIEERPEFMVTLMAIDGASEEVAEDIREVMGLDFPLSSFDLDLDETKLTLEGLDAVETVSLSIVSGILQVRITERNPAVVWRTASAIELLDEKGRRVEGLSARRDRPDLPLLAGAGADGAVSEAIALLRIAGPLSGRIRGLQRISERRWDLILDRGQRIMLPAAAPVAALRKVMLLEQKQELLDRDLVAVDMRNINRPTLRLSAPAAADLRRIKISEFGGPSE
jgi:cell division protein FtsQ